MIETLKITRELNDINVRASIFRTCISSLSNFSKFDENDLFSDPR